MDKLDASSTSIWEDLFPYRMSLIEEKLSPPGGYREMSLEEGYMGRVSIWNDTYDFFKEVVTYQEGGLVCPISDVWYDTEDEDFLIEWAFIFITLMLTLRIISFNPQSLVIRAGL